MEKAKLYFEVQQAYEILNHYLLKQVYDRWGIEGVKQYRSGKLA